MGVWKRASLYLTRKRGKSLILLAILTVIATLVLLCISVGNAADASMEQLRETMGGYFKITSNIERGHVNNVNDELVQRIMDAGGIKAYNGMNINYMFAEDIELEPGRFTAEGDEKAKLARFLGNTDSDLNEYFYLGYYSIKEGRHITPEDTGKVLISEALADRNGLSVGDTLSVKMNDENMPDQLKKNISSHTLEVAGIYRIDASQVADSANAAECDLEENFIFTDTACIREIYQELLGCDDYDVYTDGASFFVENPKKLNEIVENLSELEGYNWEEEYAVTRNNKTYEDSAGPLERLSGLVTMMVAVILVISVVMLSLILFLWIRERIYEIGVYLSVGIKKSGIIGQHMIENLMIALLAFFLAWGISWGVSGTVEKAIGNMFAAEAEDSAYMAGTTEKTEDTSLVEVRIGVIELAEILGIGFCIIILTTGISSVTVLRMRPKDIFSAMS